MFSMLYFSAIASRHSSIGVEQSNLDSLSRTFDFKVLSVKKFGRIFSLLDTLPTPRQAAPLTRLSAPLATLARTYNCWLHVA